MCLRSCEWEPSEGEEAGGGEGAQSVEALGILGRNWVCSCGQSDSAPMALGKAHLVAVESRWEEGAERGDEGWSESHHGRSERSGAPGL